MKELIPLLGVFDTISTESAAHQCEHHQKKKPNFNPNSNTRNGELGSPQKRARPENRNKEGPRKKPRRR